jgi:glycosyltransferase involved in cell wall biosynthesis
MQKTCIIIPCYNEERRIDLKAFSKFVITNSNFHFLFVNDGSSDNTLTRLQELNNKNPDSFSILDLKENRGKGNAIRLAVLSVLDTNIHYAYIGFLDADLSTPLNELLLLVKRFSEKPKLVLVSGIRLKRMGSTVIRSGKRHYIGRIFSTVTSRLFKIDNYDTQCGAKIFRYDSCYALFYSAFLSRWLFDIEIFLRIKKMVGSRQYNEVIEETPLSVWMERSKSKINWTDIVMVPIQLIKIYLNYNDTHARKRQD